MPLSGRHGKQSGKGGARRAPHWRARRAMPWENVTRDWQTLRQLVKHRCVSGARNLREAPQKRDMQRSADFGDTRRQGSTPVVSRWLQLCRQRAHLTHMLRAVLIDTALR